MKYRKTLYTKTLILILKGNMLKYIFTHMQTTLCSQNYIYITYLIPVYCTTVQHTVALPLIYYILDSNSLNPQYHQMFAQVKTVVTFANLHYLLLNSLRVYGQY